MRFDSPRLKHGGLLHHTKIKITWANKTAPTFEPELSIVSYQAVYYHVSFVCHSAMSNSNRRKGHRLAKHQHA